MRHSLRGVQYAVAHNCSYTQHDLQPHHRRRWNASRCAAPSPRAEIDAFDGFLLEFSELHQQLRIAREERLHDQTQASRALIRNLAHEIKNPLGGLRGAAQLLERELERPELTEYTQVIMKEADRLQSLMDRLLAPNRIPQRRSLNIHEALERVRSLLLAEYPHEPAHPPRLRRQPPAGGGGREQIIQALLNIARNAAQALKGRGEIVLRTRVARQVTLARKLHRLGVHGADRGQRARRARRHPRQDLLSAGVRAAKAAPAWA